MRRASARSVYTGRLYSPEQPLCFDERDFCLELIGGGSETIEDETNRWLDAEQQALEQIRRDFGDEDLEFAEPGYPHWDAGFAHGVAAVLSELAWYCKGWIAPNDQSKVPPAHIEIDLRIIERQHEIWIDYDDAPLPTPPKAQIEDRRDENAIVEQAVEIRKNEGLSIVEIGERLGVPHTTLSTWLRASGHDLQAICPTAKQVAWRDRGRNLEWIVAEAQRLRREEGLGRKKIAERLGIPAGSMGYYLEPGALDRLARGGARKPKPKHDIDAIVAEAVRLRRKEGLGPKALGERLGINPNSLSAWLSKAGVRLTEIGPLSADAHVYKRRDAPDQSQVHPDSTQVVGDLKTSEEVPELFKEKVRELPKMARRLAADGWTEDAILGRLRGVIAVLPRHVQNVVEPQLERIVSASQ